MLDSYGAHLVPAMRAIVFLTVFSKEEHLKGDAFSTARAHRRSSRRLDRLIG